MDDTHVDFSISSSFSKNVDIEFSAIVGGSVWGAGLFIFCIFCIFFISWGHMT